MTRLIMNATCQLVIGMALLATAGRGPAAATRIAADKDTARLVSGYLDVRVSLRQPAFVSLRVDSLGLSEWGADSLRPPARVSESFQVRCETNPVLGVQYSRSAHTAAHPGGWRIEVAERSIRLLSHWSEAEKPEALALEFDPHKCHVTLLGLFNQDGSIRLPAVMHFPDQGSFQITADGGADLALGYDARRTNGGATASFAYFTLAALYDLGRRQEADSILFPMLEAFAKGSFQGQADNGMSNDWNAWDGTPWGYEGFLVDNYYALLAALTREGLDQTGASPARR